MNIKQLVRTIVFASTWAIASLTQAATEILDQVVAIVDDDIIMASELRDRITAVSGSIH